MWILLCDASTQYEMGCPTSCLYSLGIAVSLLQMLGWRKGLSSHVAFECYFYLTLLLFFP